MQWKTEHDAIFLRKVLASDLYSTRKGNSERRKFGHSLLKSWMKCPAVNLLLHKNPYTCKAFDAEAQAKNEVRGES